MRVNLWHNKEVSQWRWTLTDDLDDRRMESGNSSELRVALDDVRLTIEHLMKGGGG